jgi:UDP-N-acetylglucosamine:LPS N-acetylglucosamine transferase
LLVRGDVNGKPILRSGDTVVDYLTSADLERVLKGADIVVARSGYSTLMDLNVLGKKAIFVPTPGQTEQEYLAKKLMTDRVAFSMDQQEFDLNKAISELEKYNGFSAAASNERLVQVLTELSKDEKIY